jgi:Holliday junction resolvase RusA-like endonuclease
MSDVVTEQVFTIPLPPGLNNMYPTVIVKGRARRVLSGRGKAWKKAATEIIKQVQTDLGYEKWDGPVSVGITVWRDNVRSDLDGFIKPVLDVLKGLCYNDDKQVVAIQAYRFTDKELPACEVTVERLPDWDEGGLV